MARCKNTGLIIPETGKKLEAFMLHNFSTPLFGMTDGQSNYITLYPVSNNKVELSGPWELLSNAFGVSKGSGDALLFKGEEKNGATEYTALIKTETPDSEPASMVVNVTLQKTGDSFYVGEPMACYYYEDQDGFDVLSANLTNYHLKQAIKDFASLSTGDSNITTNAADRLLKALPDAEGYLQEIAKGMNFTSVGKSNNPGM